MGRRGIRAGACTHARHFLIDRLLLLRDSLGPLHGVVRVARRAALLVLVEQTTRVSETPRCRRALLTTASVRRCRSLSHRVGGLLETTRALAQLLVLLL